VLVNEEERTRFDFESALPSSIVTASPQTPSIDDKESNAEQNMMEIAETFALWSHAGEERQSVKGVESLEDDEGREHG
jgi:hypothetical protein